MKIITTEVLISRQMEVPIITGVYDPVSRKYDGTITLQALALQLELGRSL